MNRSARLVCSLILILFFVPVLWGQEKVDLETISRIRYEGFRDSKVMELASGLMDSIGERLTGSPNMKRANEWTRPAHRHGPGQCSPRTVGSLRPRMGQSIR